jgi:hypothetical protein
MIERLRLKAKRAFENHETLALPSALPPA